MKFNFDLFGQVPINKYELNKYLKRHEGDSIDDAIRYLTIQKITGKPARRSKKNHQRGVVYDVVTVTPLSLTNYIETCQSKTSFTKYLTSILIEIKRQEDDQIRQNEMLKRAERKSQLLKQAQDLIHELIALNRTHRTAKNNGSSPVNIKRQKYLTTEHVKLFYRSHIDKSVIPWYLATEKAKLLGQEYGIYIEHQCPWIGKSTK